MDKKKKLLKLFTDDISYNYHLIKTNEPEGHLIYLIKSGSELERSSLEFSPTLIVEELIKECMIKVEKFAPSVFWCEDIDTSNLKIKLNQKLSESVIFSEFVEYIKDDYRILEIQDSLLYKKNPDEYDAERKREHEIRQRELLDDFIKQAKQKQQKREDILLEYNNNLIKLMIDWFKPIIEFENKDFDFSVELDKFLGNFIDPESWIKVNNKPLTCRSEIISLNENNMKVFLTDNENSYIATLRFDKTKLVTENTRKLNSWDSPQVSQDYDILIKLFDINIDVIIDWCSMTDSDKIEYVINLLVPIFKEEKIKKEQEYVDKIKSEEEQKKSILNKKSSKILQTDVKAKYDILISDWKNEQSKLNLNNIPGQGTRNRLLKQAESEINLNKK
jgi:hypothetical protein